MFEKISSYGVQFPRRVVVGMLLLVALFAFETFNFDTTRYALSDFFGEISFAGIRWAAILAIAFCAIDFAALVRLFTPEGSGETPSEVWYLMGAWLLGATMNALMTWWAVSLTLLSHEFGNEVLSRQQLLQIVPIFVAVLVWLTRILFIGALTYTGGHLLAFGHEARREPKPVRQPRARRTTPPTGPPVRESAPLVSERTLPTTSDLPPFLHEGRPGSPLATRPGIRRVDQNGRPDRGGE